MEEKNRLAKRILDKIDQHQQELALKQQQLDTKMKELLELRAQQAAVSQKLIGAIVIPRMMELASHFENARIEVLNVDADSNCICVFNHTPRFPATVKLSIALLPADDRRLVANYDLTILPELMEFNRSNKMDFSLEGDEKELAEWVEDRIVEFVDTYLRLETHPLYQKDNMVVDIVCGMRISSTAATSTLDQAGRTFYFCSENCKEAFIKGN